jgi:tripartite-type tricarboxylate transporter receptor subunit TctC
MAELLALAVRKRAARRKSDTRPSQAGLPQVISSSWFCLGAPVATPAEAIKTLSTAMTRVLKLPAYRAKLAEFGLEPFELSPAEATAFIASELDKWTNLVAVANIQAE